MSAESTRPVHSNSGDAQRTERAPGASKTPGNVPNIAKLLKGMHVLIFTDIQLYGSALMQVLPSSVSVSVSDATEEAIDAVAEKQVDAVLLDLAMRGSLGKARRITRVFPGDHVLALSVSGEEREIRGLLRAGVAGYLSRGASAEEFLKAVVKTVRGEAVLPDRIGRYLVHEASSGRERATARRAIERFTRRELEISRLVVLKLSNQEICDRLSIGMGTTKNHVHSLLAKTGARSRDDLATLLGRYLHPVVPEKIDQKI